MHTSIYLKSSQADALEADLAIKISRISIGLCDIDCTGFSVIKALDLYDQ